MYLLHSLERENATHKDKLDASIATIATPPSTTPTPEIIAPTTTTDHGNALIVALKEQSVTQTSKITKLIAALSARGGSNGHGERGQGRYDSGRGCGNSRRGCGDGNKNPKHK